MQTIDLIQLDIQKLRTERAEVESRLLKIDKEIDELELSIRVIQRYASTAKLSQVLFSESFNAGAVAILKPTVTKRHVMLRAVVDFLEEKSKHTDEILKHLNNREIYIAGETEDAKLKNLSTYLSRAKVEIGLVSSKRDGWSRSPSRKKGESPAVTGLSSSTESLQGQHTLGV
jgi:hypothetical protein